MRPFKALTRNFPFSVGLISWAITFIDCKEKLFSQVCLDLPGTKGRMNVAVAPQ